MNVIPGQEPSSGPNYYAFDDNVLYEIKVDNDKDGDASDIIYQFRFQTETRSPDQFIATLGGGPLPPISAIDGPGSEGLSRVQRYTVTELRHCKDNAKGPRCASTTVLFDGQLQPTVPSNIGPRTMPQYDTLRQQGIRTDAATGIRVFAGQNAETFAIDLGAVFDTVNLRVENASVIPMARPPLPIQTAAEDANDFVNPFGINAFSGFNINSIAIEVPISRLTADGQPASAANGTIGIYASTSRQMLTVRAGDPRPVKEGKPLLKGSKDFRQVSRMANPLVNELIIRDRAQGLLERRSTRPTRRSSSTPTAPSTWRAPSRPSPAFRCRPRRARTSSSCCSSTPGRAPTRASDRSPSCCDST